MNFSTINIEVNDGIGSIVLNRPHKRNALSIQMRHEISECLTKWTNSISVNVVIITGVGSAFSAGFDLLEFEQLDIHNQLFKSSSIYHKAVWNFSKPIIAAINGPAIGGGFDLTTLCDIRIASQSAVFGHPEIKFGAPPLFTPLRWIIGEGRARELCLTGRKIDATEALRIGLVSQVVDNEALQDKAKEMARTIMEAPLEALLFTKGCFTRNSGLSFEESFSLEHDEAFQKIILKAFKELKKEK